MVLPPSMSAECCLVFAYPRCHDVVHAIILSCFDYCNSVLSSISTSHLSDLDQHISWKHIHATERIHDSLGSRGCDIKWLYNDNGLFQFVWTATMACKQGRLTPASEVLISYLPLSHVAAQILDIFIPLMYAGTVYFAQPDALKVNVSTCQPFTLLPIIFLCKCT